MGDPNKTLNINLKSNPEKGISSYVLKDNVKLKTRPSIKPPTFLIQLFKEKDSCYNYT